ncbi:MAG TPA: MBOAT family O-acyltransferase [Candidatus Melainabacteria bacterium]|nr:MBOAT family O-acyltransferase [Candidatus Melainabacteria bacterium]
MLFNSLSYFIFFPAVFALYWLSPRALKKPVLLLASYIFYMSWIPKYGLLVAALTGVNYGLGLLLSKFRKTPSDSNGSMSTSARLTLILGLILNLGCLIYFKYINFLCTTFTELLNNGLGVLNIQAPKFYAITFDIILPLGISFFVFEFIHYIVDVAKGEKPVRNPIDFALFAAFFPSQIAGPIKRFENFIEQLDTRPGHTGKALQFRSTDMHAGLALLLQGLFKKVAIADNLAILANAGFNPAVSLNCADTWIAVLAFTFQIYFDFSGYTDMGRGSALMLGISLPDNFNFPYLAKSVSDFWRRWHISLSTWLRDYLYIPLGGGRSNKNRNLFLTMLLGGLWHGAAMHFVAWGAYQGAMLALNNWYDNVAKRSETLRNFHAHAGGKICAALFTFLLVIVGWTLFRADTVGQAFHILEVMFLGAGSSVSSAPLLWTALTRSPVITALLLYSSYATLFCLPKFLNQGEIKMRPLDAIGWSVRVPFYATVAIAAVAFAPAQPSSFIYFQF